MACMSVSPAYCLYVIDISSLNRSVEDGSKALKVILEA